MDIEKFEDLIEELQDWLDERREIYPLPDRELFRHVLGVRGNRGC